MSQMLGCAKCGRLFIVSTETRDSLCNRCTPNPTAHTHICASCDKPFTPTAETIGPYCGDPCPKGLIFGAPGKVDLPIVELTAAANQFRLEDVGQTVDLTDRPDITGLVLDHAFVEGCCSYEKWRHVHEGQMPPPSSGTMTIGPISYIEKTEIKWK